MSKKITSIENIYKKLISPILKRDDGVDAEYLTNLSLSLLGFTSNKRDWPIIKNIIVNLSKELTVKNEKLNQSICGINFCNPLGLAAGFDKNGIAANIWQDFGFGFSEIGTVTKLSQPGNPKPRLFRLSKEEAALNRMGFNNKGATNMVNNLTSQKIQELKDKQKICLGINFGKSKITPLENYKEDYISSLKILAPYCNYAAINVSSPNTEGLRKLQDPELLRELIKEIKSLSNCPPIFIKIAPDLSFQEIEKICQLINDEKANGLIATNTSLDRLGLENRLINKTGLKLSQEIGGLSGKPLKIKANRIIKHINKIDKSLIVIGVGGINSPESAWERICSGASLIQLYTGWIYKGPQLVPEILNGIVKQLNIHQLSNIKDAIGSDLKWEE